MRALLALALTAAACGAGGDDGSPIPDQLVTYGQPYTGGQFHLGPVDWEESQWHNACAPGGGYSATIRALEGSYLAGLWNGIPDVAGLCDACIYVTTEQGKSALLRVVTYGDTTTNSIDVSPAAYDVLDSGEFPRAMTWQLARCNDTGPIHYEFQSGAHQWWTSLWVRNARVPIERVEVTSVNHATPITLQRGSDGTLTDAGGFGEGPFRLRVIGIDGQTVTDQFDWPASGIGGQILVGQGNFH